MYHTNSYIRTDCENLVQVTAIVDAILRTNPLIDVGLKVDLQEDQVTKLREAMNMITRVLIGQNEVLYPGDVHRIVNHLGVLMK